MVGPRTVREQHHRVVGGIDELHRLLLGVKGDPETGEWIPIGTELLDRHADRGYASEGDVTGGERDEAGEEAEGEDDGDYVEDVEEDEAEDEEEEEEEEDDRPVKKRR